MCILSSFPREVPSCVARRIKIWNKYLATNIDYSVAPITMIATDTLPWVAQ